MPKRTRLHPLLLLALTAAAALTLLAVTSTARACPSCTETIANNDASGADAGDVGRGFNYSIIVMMPVPYLLAAGFGGTCYWYMRKNGATVQLSQPASPAPPASSASAAKSAPAAPPDQTERL